MLLILLVRAILALIPEFQDLLSLVGGLSQVPDWSYQVMEFVLPLLPVGAVWAADRWLVPWMVPVPAWECPRCGHALPEEGLVKCSECGTPHDGGSGGPSKPA